MTDPSGSQSVAGLKAHFSRQIGHYNALRKERYLSDLAEDVVYAVNPTLVLSGMSKVQGWY